MDDKVAFIEKWDPFSAKKIRMLLEKKPALVEEAISMESDTRIDSFRSP